MSPAELAAAVAVHGSFLVQWRFDANGLDVWELLDGAGEVSTDVVLAATKAGLGRFVAWRRGDQFRGLKKPTFEAVPSVWRCMPPAGVTLTQYRIEHGTPERPVSLGHVFAVDAAEAMHVANLGGLVMVDQYARAVEIEPPPFDGR